eukprot:73185_1
MTMETDRNTKINSCATSDLLSQNVTIVYASVYALFLIIVSAYSFNFLMKYETKFINSSCAKRLKIWFMDTWKRRKCYIPILAHIFDQVTDITVAIQFYELATRNGQSDNQWLKCNGLNIWYLFILTILSMTIYRLISSFLIFKITKSFGRFLSQMADVELLRALYVNYLCDSIEPCDPQRYITTLEATLESSPQTLIQLIYLVKTGSFTSSYVVVISFVSSLLCIVFKLISDDKSIVIKQAKSS